MRGKKRKTGARADVKSDDEDKARFAGIDMDARKRGDSEDCEEKEKSAKKPKIFEYNKF